MTAENGDELLDIRQAAQFLQVSETSLRRWTNSGRLASLRVGQRRERRFRRADLVAFLEHHPVGHEKPKPLPPPPGTHMCGLYGSEDGRTSQAVAFIAAGLRPGTVTLLVASLEAQRHIFERLEQRLGYPVQTEIHSGRLVVSQYAETPHEQVKFFENWMIDAERTGVTNLRVVGDISGGPLGRGKTAAQIDEYESQYHRVIARRYPTVTLCQYDARAHDGPDLLGILKSHGDNFSFPVELLLA